MRSWMSLIMGLIGLEQLELFALELEKLVHLTLFTLASTIEPMGTRHGQTIHDHKISLEFDYGCNQIRCTAVICP